MGKGFQFKQFYITQDRCAMKVSETACVFGAFIPLIGNEKSILDVGTGTGVLALMLAQRTKADITAIDIDENAVDEARHNIEASTFAARIMVKKEDFVTWPTQQRFDLIVCNPPFYENQLPSTDSQKRMAWHSSHLTLEHLLVKSYSCLTEEGRIAIVLPIERIIDVIKLAKHLQLRPYFNYTLQHNEAKPIKYGMIGLVKQGGAPLIERRIVLRNELNEYTPIVRKGLQPFYSSL